MTAHDQPSGVTLCANCGRLIRRPDPGSYPETVEWVHVHNPLGAGNRYCGTDGYTARPSRGGQP